MKISMIVLMALLLIGCTAENENVSVIPNETAAENESTVSSETPETPDTSEDIGLPEEMPKDFDISYSWWIGGKNTLDTYENYIEKDLVFDGTVTAEYFPDEAEMKEIDYIIGEMKADAKGGQKSDTEYFSYMYGSYSCHNIDC